jgi:hypothetical protein
MKPVCAAQQCPMPPVFSDTIAPADSEVPAGVSAKELSCQLAIQLFSSWRAKYYDTRLVGKRTTRPRTANWPPRCLPVVSPALQVRKSRTSAKHCWPLTGASAGLLWLVAGCSPRLLLH